MTYDDAVRGLATAGEETGAAIGLETAVTQFAYVTAVFGADLAAAIGKAGYPGGAEVPLVVEELYIYLLDELEEKQEGYRTDTTSGQPSADWDPDRFVIADWAANPVSIGSEGGISYARHGEGSWRQQSIAPNLSSFLLALATWLRFVSDRGGRVQDDGFEVPATVRDELMERLPRDIPEESRARLANFFLGEI